MTDVTTVDPSSLTWLLVKWEGASAALPPHQPPLSSMQQMRGQIEGVIKTSARAIAMTRVNAHTEALRELDRVAGDIAQRESVAKAEAMSRAIDRYPELWQRERAARAAVTALTRRSVRDAELVATAKAELDASWASLNPTSPRMNGPADERRRLNAELSTLVAEQRRLGLGSLEAQEAAHDSPRGVAIRARLCELRGR